MQESNLDGQAYLLFQYVQLQYDVLNIFEFLDILGNFFFWLLSTEFFAKCWRDAPAY
jgi:hypothetical protein